MISKKEEILEELKAFKPAKIEHYKSSLKALYQDSSFPESDPNKSFSKSLILMIRKSLEERMKKSLNLQSPFYNEEINQMLLFLFWAAEQDIIDFNSVWGFLEDLYECLCLKDVAALFTFLEKSINKLSKPNVQVLLRICNSLLKKLSKVNDTQLRGRIHVFLSKMLPISHESGTNLKSVCDFTPTSFELEPREPQKSSFEVLNFNTYRKFWSLQKFLQNPLGIFIDDEPENESNNILFKEDEEIEENPNNTNTNLNSKKKTDLNPKSLRFNKFFENVLNILEIFNANPVVLNENPGSSNNANKFPKFLTQSCLTETQFKDPNFRKIWLTQLLLAIHSLKNPVKIAPQKNYILLADQKKTLEKAEEMVYKQLNELSKNDTKPPGEQIDSFLQKDKLWQEWKENNCPNYEKPSAKEILENFKLLEDYQKKHGKKGILAMDKPVHEKKKGLKNTNKEKETSFNEFVSKFTEKTAMVVQDNVGTLRKMGMFDLNTELFKFLDLSKIEISEEPIEPSVAFFFDRIYYDMDPANEVHEEDKMKKDPNYIWKALRILARNDLTAFKANTNSDLTSDCIIDEIAQKLKKISSNPIAQTLESNLKDSEGKPVLIPDNEPPLKTTISSTPMIIEKEKTGEKEKEVKEKIEKPIEKPTKILTSTPNKPTGLKRAPVQEELETESMPLKSKIIKK